MWGSTQLNLQEGITGEVKRYPLEEYDKLAIYQSPIHMIRNLEIESLGVQFCKANKAKFICGGWISLFERM